MNEQCATERKTKGRKVERKMRNATKTWPSAENGRQASEKAEKNCASRSQQQSQPNKLAVTLEQTYVTPLQEGEKLLPVKLE